MKKQKDTKMAGKFHRSFLNMSAQIPVKAMSLVVLHRLVQKLETNGTHAFRVSTVYTDTSLLRIYLSRYIHLNQPFLSKVTITWSLKCIGEGPSEPYAKHCMLHFGNLDIHPGPEKLHHHKIHQIFKTVSCLNIYNTTDKTFLKSCVCISPCMQHIQFLVNSSCSL